MGKGNAFLLFIGLCKGKGDNLNSPASTLRVKRPIQSFAILFIVAFIMLSLTLPMKAEADFVSDAPCEDISPGMFSYHTKGEIIQIWNGISYAIPESGLYIYALGVSEAIHALAPHTIDDWETGSWYCDPYSRGNPYNLKYKFLDQFIVPRHPYLILPAWREMVYTVAEMSNGKWHPKDSLGQELRLLRNRKLWVSNQNDDPCAGIGSPVWSVNVINMNLYVSDTPIWYTPAYGPKVELQMSYNSQAAIDTMAPFGNKWTFDYGSYVNVNADNSVTVTMPDGRQDIYSNPNATGTYLTRPMEVFGNLTKVSDTRYTLAFVDGTVYTYDILDGSQRGVLTKMADAYGQGLNLIYQGNQLLSITDALNNTALSFAYYPGKVTVTDPFDRTAEFLFDSSHNLVSATDMGGYVTAYTYDASGNSYLASITNPKGTWGFKVEPDDDHVDTAATYPAPDDPLGMGYNYRLTITDPYSNKEEYFYDGASTWHVSPRDYVPYFTDPVTGSVSSNLSAAKTSYFFDTTSYPKAEIVSILTPELNTARFTYDRVTGLPASISDGKGNMEHYQYNPNGLVTYFWDATVATPTTSPDNSTIAYTYQNNADVLTVDNHSGPALITYEYHGAPHEVTAVTDRMGDRTEFHHNGFGQLTSVVEAANNALIQTTTVLDYDPAKHTLNAISKQKTVNDPKYLVTALDYDAAGRLSNATYASGVTIKYDYEKLDQVKTITYPDQRTVQIVNNSSCPYLLDSITERAGDIRKTSYYYDALKRLDHAIGPDGIFKYGYDNNGNMTRFTVVTDPNSMTGTDTLFDYTLDNRLKTKTYADGSSVSYKYDQGGMIDTFTNARFNTTSYIYDANNNVTSITYSDNTPAVTLRYDAYNRLYKRSDGIGVYQFAYDLNGRLTDVYYPWDNPTNSMAVDVIPGNDTLHYDYDDLGRLTAITPLLGQKIMYGYDDPIGRLKTFQRASDLLPFTYSYDTSMPASPLPQQLTRPNGSYTQYQYNDPLKRITSVINNSLIGQISQIISRYDYTYNNLDLRRTEKISSGLSVGSLPTGTTYYSPNSLNQITADTLNPTIPYAYDADGNMTKGFTPMQASAPNGSPLTMAYDAENRLRQASFSDSQGIHTTNYYYSGNGLLARTTKSGAMTAETRYVRSGFLPIQERDGGNHVIREYVWGKNMGGGIGGLLSMHQSSDGKDYYYLYDGKGNVTALIDSSQAMVASYAYGPFGVLKKTSLAPGFTDQPFKFSTKPYDPDTGLSYYGFRFYDPSVGKWVSRDPFGEDSDVNLYRFNGNDPVNRIDPLGLLSPKGVFLLYSARDYQKALSEMSDGIRGKDPSVSKSDADQMSNDILLEMTIPEGIKAKGLKDNNDMNGLENLLKDIYERVKKKKKC